MPRSAPPSAGLGLIEQKLDQVLEAITTRAQQNDESLAELSVEVTSLRETVETLRIAIDDIRAELEWTMRNHAPKRAPPTDLPVKSLPKFVPKGEQPPESSPETGRLF
jgi:hypothetical protein